MKATEPVDSYDSVLYTLPDSGVACLLEYGYGVDQTDACGEYMLTMACQRLQLSGVTLLLSRGANTNCKNAEGNTPLLCAIDVSHHNASIALEIVKALLAAGADMEARGYMDKTPFLKACSRGCLDILKLLVISGCDIHAEAKEFDGRGLTGLDLSRMFDTGFEFKDYLRTLYAT
jgi:ankyrin repeat protein